MVHTISTSTVDQVDIASINSDPQGNNAVCAFQVALNSLENKSGLIDGVAIELK